MKRILSILILSILTVNVIAVNEDVKKESASATPSVAVSSVKGKVVDKSTGEALAGVLVKVNENTIVYTDFDGNFTFNIAQPKAKICVSLISYATTEVELEKNSNEIKIELQSVE